MTKRLGEGFRAFLRGSGGRVGGVAGVFVEEFFEVEEGFFVEVVAEEGDAAGEGEVEEGAEEDEGGGVGGEEIFEEVAEEEVGGGEDDGAPDVEAVAVFAEPAERGPGEEGGDEPGAGAGADDAGG